MIAVLQLLQLADSLPGFGMESVTQKLYVDEQRRGVMTENSSVFRFGPLGTWRVRVLGVWLDQGGGMCASASFDTFTMRPVSFFGLPTEVSLGQVAGSKARPAPPVLAPVDPFILSWFMHAFQSQCS